MAGNLMIQALKLAPSRHDTESNSTKWLEATWEKERVALATAWGKQIAWNLGL